MSYHETNKLHAKGTADQLRATLLQVPAERRPSFEKAHIVLAVLAAKYRPDRGYTDESLDQIADATSLSPRTVERVLQAFDAAGITVQIRRSQPKSAPRRTLPFLVGESADEGASTHDESLRGDERDHHAVDDPSLRGSEANTTRYEPDHHAVDRVPPRSSPDVLSQVLPRSLSSSDAFRGAEDTTAERETSDAPRLAALMAELWRRDGFMLVDADARRSMEQLLAGGVDTATIEAVLRRLADGIGKQASYWRGVKPAKLAESWNVIVAALRQRLTREESFAAMMFDDVTGKALDDPWDAFWDRRSSPGPAVIEATISEPAELSPGADIARLLAELDGRATQLGMTAPAVTGTGWDDCDNCGDEAVAE